MVLIQYVLVPVLHGQTTISYSALLPSKNSSLAMWDYTSYRRAILTQCYCAMDFTAWWKRLKNCYPNAVDLYTQHMYMLLTNFLCVCLVNVLCFLSSTFLMVCSGLAAAGGLGWWSLIKFWRLTIIIRITKCITILKSSSFILSESISSPLSASSNGCFKGSLNSTREDTGVIPSSDVWDVLLTFPRRFPFPTE